MTCDGTALVPLGVDLEPPERRALTGEARLLVRGQRRHRVGEHRVAAVLHAGGARVVGLAREVEAVAAVRPDLAGDAPRRRRGRRGRVPARRAARRSSRRRPATAAADRVEPGGRRRRRRGGRRRGPGARASASQVVAPVTRREPRQARPKRDPSSSVKTETPIGRARLEARVTQHVDRRQRRDDAQRAVERASVVDGVEVRAGAGRRVLRGDVGRHHATWLPIAVGLDIQPARGAASANHARSSASAEVHG